MSDPAPLPPVPVATVAPTDDLHTMAIVVYGLMLGGFLCGGLSTLAGVIVAYIKRDEARGTIWESHFQNAIHAFWVSLIAFLAGIALMLVFVGIFVMLGAAAYMLYRAIKGLIAAVDGKPYV